MSGTDPAILAGIWSAYRKHFGAVWSRVRVFAGTAVVGRRLGNEAIALDTWVVLALVLDRLTPAPREGGRAAATEGIPSDDTVPAVFTGVGLAWIIVFIVPVGVLGGGLRDTGVFVWTGLLVTVVIVIGGPIWVWRCNEWHQ